MQSCPLFVGFFVMKNGAAEGFNQERGFKCIFKFLKMAPTT